MDAADDATDLDAGAPVRYDEVPDCGEPSLWSLPTSAPLIQVDVGNPRSSCGWHGGFPLLTHRLVEADCLRFLETTAGGVAGATGSFSASVDVTAAWPTTPAQRVETRNHRDDGSLVGAIVTLRREAPQRRTADLPIPGYHVSSVGAYPELVLASDVPSPDGTVRFAAALGRHVWLTPRVLYVGDGEGPRHALPAPEGVTMDGETTLLLDQQGRFGVVIEEGRAFGFSVSGAGGGDVEGFPFSVPVSRRAVLVGSTLVLRGIDDELSAWSLPTGDEVRVDVPEDLSGPDWVLTAGPSGQAFLAGADGLVSLLLGSDGKGTVVADGAGRPAFAAGDLAAIGKPLAAVTADRAFVIGLVGMAISIDTDVPVFGPTRVLWVDAGPGDSLPGELLEARFATEALLVLRLGRGDGREILELRWQGEGLCGE